MINPTVIKVAKIALSVIGVGATLATNYFESKELDAKIAEKVAKAFAERK